MPPTLISLAELDRATDALAHGQLVAMPTETVYGLAADARDPAAIARIYAAKGRPAHNPLIVHVATLAEAQRYAHFDARALLVATQLWPGPLTLVLPLRADAGLAPAVTAGLGTVALRVPAHPIAQALLAAFAGPLAAPSANASGEPSPTRAAHVLASLPSAALLVLDGGPSQVGLESSILHLAGPTPTLLRRGSISHEALAALLGHVALSDGDPSRPNAPGQTLRHYAPRAPLRLNANSAGPTEAWLGFGEDPPALSARVSLSLSPTASLDEAARQLYHALRTLDQPGITAICVAPIPETGLGHALLDRLRRAASAPR